MTPSAKPGAALRGAGNARGPLCHLGLRLDAHPPRDLYRIKDFDEAYDASRRIAAIQPRDYTRHGAADPLRRLNASPSSRRAIACW
jgi:hypothetical protein